MLAAVDGSTIWVQAGPVLGLVGGSLALTSLGTVLMARGMSKNPQVALPPDANLGRRKMQLVRETSNFDENSPKTIDAERLEDVIESDPNAKPEESLRDVDRVPKK